MQDTFKTSHSKSRNGCLRCKAKKTKCDERKPACARCEDRGFPCPGYALNVRWSQKHQTNSAKAAPKDPLQTPSQDADLPEANAVVAPAATANVLSEDTQHTDTWIPSPLNWDFAMSQDLLSLDEDASLDETLLTGNTSWDRTNMAAAWCSTPLVIAEEAQTNHKRPHDDDLACSKPPEKRTKDMSRIDLTEPSFCIISTSAPMSFPGAPRELFSLPTALSEYFFREVITLYCIWDSKSNVMRNIIETKWQSSGALHHTIQSMAAACLSEDFPHLSSVAKREHCQALQEIKTNESTSTYKEDMLLAYMLLGHTASWLNPHNLATDMFRASCDMLHDITTETDSGHLSFFSDTMDYWAMLLAYLTDSQQLGGYRRDVLVGPTHPSTTVEPHPYSGISRETVKLLTDTGMLIFRYRKHMSAVKFMTEDDLDVFRVALREARRLERALLSHRPPDVSRIKDPGDPKTPLNHLQLLDEAYRCTGLLQLYRVFPDLLNERYAPWDEDHILYPPPATKAPTAQERRTWLTKLSIHVLGILQAIPFESRTRSAQPFILVAVSSELRRDPQHIQPLESNDQDPGTITIDQISIEVARSRKFIRSRLAAYAHILPLVKIRVIFELVNCVWAALDGGEKDVYWLDIAREKNLVTMMG